MTIAQRSLLRQTAGVVFHGVLAVWILGAALLFGLRIAYAFYSANRAAIEALLDSLW